MPRTSKTEAPITLDLPVIEGRYIELDGYTVGFETHKADLDPAPLFRGLPDDHCPCPHRGVVISGRLVFRYPDRDGTFHAGDAYYGAPGHLPLMSADTELIEFTPTEALNATMAVIAANLEASSTNTDGVPCPPSRCRVTAHEPLHRASGSEIATWRAGRACVRRTYLAATGAGP